MQNDRSQRQWRSLDMQINQYAPSDSELVRQNQREQKPRYQPQSWPHQGLPTAEQSYYTRNEQGQNICSGGSQGTIPSYVSSNDNQQAMGSTQTPRVDWVDGVAEVQALLRAPDRTSLQATESGMTAVNPIVSQLSPVPAADANQELTLEIPSQERGHIPLWSHEGGAHDRPYRAASMAIRDLIEPTSPDTVDRNPQPPGAIAGGGSELLSYARRSSAPLTTAESAKQPASAPMFHVTGTESNYLYATASSSDQGPVIDYASAAPRPRLLPGHCYYDPNASLSPSPHTRLQYSWEPGCSTTPSRVPFQDRSRVEPSASLPPVLHGHQNSSEPATFRPETIQLDPDRHVPLSRSPVPPALLSASVRDLRPGNCDTRREPSPHAHLRAHSQHTLSPLSQAYNLGTEYRICGPAEAHAYSSQPSNRSSRDHQHSSQLGYSRSQGCGTSPSASPHNQSFTSNATRREPPQDQHSHSTTSHSTSTATLQYSPAFTLQPITTSSSAKNLKSTPYYATLRPAPSGSKQAWSPTGSSSLDITIGESTTTSPALPEVPKPLPSSRRRRGSSRHRNPTSTRSMPNLLYKSETDNLVTDAFSSQRQTMISEESSQTDEPQGFSGWQSGPRTVGTVTPRGHETDVVMSGAFPPPRPETIIDARLKEIPRRTPGEKTAISLRGADAWRLHIPQEPPRRAKSVENLGGRVSQYSVSSVRDQPGPVRSSRDRSPSRAMQPTGTCSNFSKEELETGLILQEMSTGLMEAHDNMSKPADLVMPAIPVPPSSKQDGEVGPQPIPPVQLTIAIGTFRNPFVLIDCALALLRYSRSRFFVANGPLMQNSYTELAESINYLGTEMQRIESTFTGQAMQEWIKTVYNVEEYKDLEKLTRYISQRMDEDQQPAEAAGTHRRLTSLIRKYVPNGRLVKWLQMMEGALKDISARQAREDPRAQEAQRRRAAEHRTKGYRLAGEASGNFFGPLLA
ncbi:hypothetical protein EV426DRAFT_595128 [Tirmania nivea]|nr:hypothetical protein EV426DRAFT_595128 [Tirmania nivea]